MKPAHLTALLLAIPLACARPEAAADSAKATGPARHQPAASEHGHALLHEFLGAERHLSRLLLIKFERKELGTVIDAIDATCSTAYRQLGDLATRDPQLDLKDMGLPDIETRTRANLRESMKQGLLAAKGPELEFQFLLCQDQALGYGAHLADALARSESDPARLAFQRQLRADLSRLQEDVRALLRKPAPRD